MRKYHYKQYFNISDIIITSNHCHKLTFLPRYAFEGVLQAIYGKDVLGNERGELDIDQEDCPPNMPCIAVTGDNVLERMDVSDAKVNNMWKMSRTALKVA